nr:MAG TPA: hypothetical protein [Crassvirales sp.]
MHGCMVERLCIKSFLYGEFIAVKCCKSLYAVVIIKIMVL